MKPSDLYKMKHEEISHHPGELIGFYYDHVKEADVESFDIDPDTQTDRLDIKIIKRHDFDARRYWQLATVWFDGKPVMIIQNAGREGDDHSRRIVTDQWGLHDLCNYIKTLKPREEVDAGDVYDADADVKDLDEFYGNSLDGIFEVY